MVAPFETAISYSLEDAIKRTLENYPPALNGDSWITVTATATYLPSYFNDWTFAETLGGNPLKLEIDCYQR